VSFHKYVTPIIAIVGTALSLWIGSSLFTYFTYNAVPEVRVVGIESGGSYKDIVRCSLNAQNGYKIKKVSLFIDDEPLAVERAQSIKAKEFKIPFELETNNLNDGEHTLKIEAVDSSYHANKSLEKIEFFVDNKSLKVAFLQNEYNVDQGRTLHAKIQVNKKDVKATVDLFSKDYECYPAGKDSSIYEVFIPVDCEQNPDQYMIRLSVIDKVGNVAKMANVLSVKKFKFPRQKGFFVPQEKLNDEKEVSMNNKILKEALKKWIFKSPPKKLWSGPFEMPTVVRRISTPYGEIRVTPEKGRYLHRAIDIVNTPKSVVWASQNGKVIIKDRYLMSGNTVVIDHGLGIFTKYFHLDEFADIEVGDSIKKGAPVGKLGMTGYANGYHLHWELSIKGVSVDPIEWTKKVF
jgi:murein DD-endopeptidase MepM/ murein hydrolase activator NlpD